jgi:hypothetical protein
VDDQFQALSLRLVRLRHRPGANRREHDRRRDSAKCGSKGQAFDPQI